MSGLEDVVREQISRCVANALTAGVPSAGMLNRATETILRAAGHGTPPPSGPGGLERTAQYAAAVELASHGWPPPVLLMAVMACSTPEEFARLAVALPEVALEFAQRHWPEGDPHRRAAMVALIDAAGGETTHAVMVADQREPVAFLPPRVLRLTEGDNGGD